MHGWDVVVDIQREGARRVLAAASMALRRYDVCILPVSPATLSWARTALSIGMPYLHTPVMALVRGLTAGALHDLHQLGVADFLREPFCEHETRLRIERLLDAPRLSVRPVVQAASLEETGPPAFYADTAHSGLPAAAQAVASVCDQEVTGLEAYAIAAASRSTGRRESFREAKSRVIERFERAYISAALGRHAGNIAMAARAAQKHRRAFWALMRKHDIDAAPFREPGGASSVPSRSPAAGLITGQGG